MGRSFRHHHLQGMDPRLVDQAIQVEEMVCHLTAQGMATPKMTHTRTMTRTQGIVIHMLMIHTPRTHMPRIHTPVIRMLVIHMQDNTIRTRTQGWHHLPHQCVGCILRTKA